MTENEALEKIKSRFTEELKNIIGEGTLLDALSAFLGSFQNAVWRDGEINRIDARNHFRLLEFVQGNEERLKSHFNRTLGLQGLFLIYEKAYQLLRENSEKSAKEVISEIYSIVKNSELGGNIKGIMDDNNQLSLLNTLANPKGAPPFATEKDFEDKVLTHVKNLLKNKDYTLDKYNKECALTEYVFALYLSIHEDIKIKNENLVSLSLQSLPWNITSYISSLSDVLHILSSPSTKVTVQELNESYHKHSRHYYSFALQKQKFIEAFECLLMHGNTDDFEKILTSPENMLCNLEGGTTLHLAAKLGYTEIVNDLVRNEADIDLVDEYGQTPLHLAAQNGHIDIVRALIEKGAKIDAVDKRGWTPLHFACQYNNHSEVIKFLLDKGANPLLRNKNGKTPRELAKNNDIKEFLKEAEKTRLKERELLKGAEKKYQEEQAFVRSLAAFGSTAVLGAVVAVALFVTGKITVGLMFIIGAVAIVTAVALAVGGITYGLLKPSTEVDKAKRENLKDNGVFPHA